MKAIEIKTEVVQGMLAITLQNSDQETVARLFEGIAATMTGEQNGNVFMALATYAGAHIAAHDEEAAAHIIAAFNAMMWEAREQHRAQKGGGHAQQ